MPPKSFDSDSELYRYRLPAAPHIEPELSHSTVEFSQFSAHDVTEIVSRGLDTPQDYDHGYPNLSPATQCKTWVSDKRSGQPHEHFINLGLREACLKSKRAVSDQSAKEKLHGLRSLRDTTETGVVDGPLVITKRAVSRVPDCAWRLINSPKGTFHAKDSVCRREVSPQAYTISCELQFGKRILLDEEFDEECAQDEFCYHAPNSAIGGRRYACCVKKSHVLKSIISRLPLSLQERDRPDTEDSQSGKRILPPVFKRGLFARSIQQCDPPHANTQFVTSMCLGSISPRAYVIICVTESRDQFLRLQGSCQYEEGCFDFTRSTYEHIVYCVRNTKGLPTISRPKQNTKARETELNRRQTRSIIERAISHSYSRCLNSVDDFLPNYSSPIYSNARTGLRHHNAVIFFGLPSYESDICMESAGGLSAKAVRAGKDSSISLRQKGEETYTRSKSLPLIQKDSQLVTQHVLSQTVVKRDLSVPGVRRIGSRLLNQCDPTHLYAKFFFSLCVPKQSAQAYKIVCNNAAVVNGHCHESEICVGALVSRRAYCVSKENIVNMVLNTKQSAS